MQRIDHIIELAGHRKEDLSACLGCKICASVCTVNDLGIDSNPQDLLVRLFLNQNVEKEHPLVQYCTGCYRCTDVCPWKIRIPEVVRALKETLGMEGLFEKAFKESVNIWGRVYEPYVVLRAMPVLLKGGYMKHLGRWMEYAGFHLPHKAKRLGKAGDSHVSQNSRSAQDG
jgi:heterodisulfide reductase subunit C